MKKLFNSRLTAKRLKAFSMPELLVVLVIIGILVLIALPNLMPLISKAKSVEASSNWSFYIRCNKAIFICIQNIHSPSMNLDLSNNRL